MRFAPDGAQIESGIIRLDPRKHLAAKIGRLSSTRVTNDPGHLGLLRFQVSPEDQEQNDHGQEEHRLTRRGRATAAPAATSAVSTATATATSATSATSASTEAPTTSRAGQHLHRIQAPEGQNQQQQPQPSEAPVMSAQQLQAR